MDRRSKVVVAGLAATLSTVSFGHLTPCAPPWFLRRRSERARSGSTLQKTAARTDLPFGYRGRMFETGQPGATSLAANAGAVLPSIGCHYQSKSLRQTSSVKGRHLAEARRSADWMWTWLAQHQNSWRFRIQEGVA